VRDPYDILGVKRGASLDEIKAAYRRLSKERHPDRGGTNDAMSELNTAYAFILNELKEGYRRQQQSDSQQQKTRDSQDAWRDVHEDTASDARRDTWWRNRYREVDEELETLRRYAEQYDEQLKTMRAAAWSTGQRAAWAQLTLEDIARFFARIARSGMKGIALLFAALVGLGSMLVEANVVSAILMIGAGLGMFVSLALKNDKGGIMSAALLLFAVMTIWVPPVRNALFTFPLATLCVLVLLGLIFKFTQAGGMVGFMTGGVLALYVLFVILGDTAQRPEVATIMPPPPRYSPPIAPSPTPTNASAPAPRPTQMTQTPERPASPQPRTLLASDGAILKIAAGVPYRLKVRTGRTTSIRADTGTVRADSGSEASAGCVNSLYFAAKASVGPWRDIDATIRSCGADAVVTVSLGT